MVICVSVCIMVVGVSVGFLRDEDLVGDDVTYVEAVDDVTDAADSVPESDAAGESCCLGETLDDEEGVTT